jgi:hypothetical protein
MFALFLRNGSRGIKDISADKGKKKFRMGINFKEYCYGMDEMDKGNVSIFANFDVAAVFLASPRHYLISLPWKRRCTGRSW